MVFLLGVCANVIFKLNMWGRKKKKEKVAQVSFFFFFFFFLEIKRNKNKFTNEKKRSRAVWSRPNTSTSIVFFKAWAPKKAAAMKNNNKKKVGWQNSFFFFAFQCFWFPSPPSRPRFWLSASSHSSPPLTYGQYNYNQVFCRPPAAFHVLFYGLVVGAGYVFSPQKKWKNKKPKIHLLHRFTH